MSSTLSTSKKLAKFILFPFYSLINLFYFPYLKRYFFSRIEKVPPSHQIFFLTRFDFGTWLMLMHYANCWNEVRGPTCLVVLVPNASLIKQLAKWICPNTLLIVHENSFSRFLFAVFKRYFLQFLTYNPIYAFARARWPYALYLFDMGFCRKNLNSHSEYIAALDPTLKKEWPFSKEFLNIYLVSREKYDVRREIYCDMVTLSFQRNAKNSTPSRRSQEAGILLEKLNIEGPYVVMNLNCKDYHNKSRNNRTITRPESYDKLIDHLIARGFKVALHGRKEQPNFDSRKGFIKYCSSPFTSPENDYHLFSQASFAVFSKTGPETFGAICNIPVLGLNYTELISVAPYYKNRIFPKHVWDKKNDVYIHWKDFLKRPCYFDIGVFSYEEGIEYIDLSEEELIQATNEFLTLLPQQAAQWFELSKEQRAFRQELREAHIGLYDVLAIPCQTYLDSDKFLCPT